MRKHRLPVSPTLASLVSVLALTVAALPSDARAEFPQIKINHIDTSQAPKIRIWASVAKYNFRPPGDKDITEVTVLRKPEGGTPVELFRFDKGVVAMPKSLSDEEQKAQEAKMAPELALAAELDQGQAIVVVVPGHQEAEYREGTLGERSRAAAGLFFKKLGKNNLMNAIWYNDFVFSYVDSADRAGGFAKLDAEIDKCEKWEKDTLKLRGLSPEELAELDPTGGEGFKPGEAHCGLTKKYDEFSKYFTKMSYDGFWPQLFGLQQKLCVTPQHQIKRTGLGGEEEAGGRINAFQTAIEMLAKHPDPAMPKILILSSDGRDGYIDAVSDCRAKYQLECQNDAEVKAAKGRAQREAMNACINNKLKGDIAVEQGSFIEKLPAWLGLAKAANIRIYSIIHPNAAPHMRDRLEVLAWRTGGTARFARDANEVVDLHESVIAELNNQIVVTFVDEEATPNSQVSYVVKAGGLIGNRDSEADATSEAYMAVVPPAIERSTIGEVKRFGESKLGKGGFMAALAGVGLLLLLILLKLFKAIFGKGKDAVAKGAKGAGGKAKDAQAKAKAKAIEKAKKAKEAQKKAMAKQKG
ncbi:MAG TPA: hypothetical protein PK095_13130 [Myxococcota bacterium]|nr:hypothetical protein [Myxococcota bacterium]